MATTHFNNRDKVKQLIDFTGILNEGKLSATDMDGMIEYKNQLYLFIEIKEGNKDLPFGQKLALERLTDDLSKVKPTIAIVAEHNITNPNVDIVMAECIVREIRFNNKWSPVESTTVRTVVDKFIKKYSNTKM